MRLIDVDALGIGKANREVFNNPNYADGWNSVIDIINNAPTVDAEELVYEQPTITPQQWIPCSERLPREYTRVLGYMAWKSMTAIEYLNGRWYSIDHLEPLPDEAVIAWMPLPKPPKEGETNE